MHNVPDTKKRMKIHLNKYKKQQQNIQTKSERPKNNGKKLTFLFNFYAP